MSKLQKIKNFIFRITSLAFFSRKNRHKFLNNYLYLNLKNNNKIIFIMKNGDEKTAKHKIKNSNIEFYGKNNTFKIAYNCDFKKSHINIVFYGNNATVNILTNKHIVIDADLCSNSYLEIGVNTYTNGSHIHLAEDNAKIIIGNNCAISWNTSFLATDYHTILNNKNEIINQTKPIIIGDNVWIGCNTTFTKGVNIASDNIIGTSSVVTKSFLENNCIIAGNPAKIVKQNIDWKIQKVDEYINFQEKASHS